MSKIKQHKKVKNLKLPFLSHHFVACYFFFNTLLFLFTSEKHTSISTPSLLVHRIKGTQNENSG